MPIKKNLSNNYITLVKMLHPLQQCNVLSFFGLHALISKQNFVPWIAVCSNHNKLSFGGGDSKDCGAVGVDHNSPLGCTLKFLPHIFEIACHCKITLEFLAHTYSRLACHCKITLKFLPHTQYCLSLQHLVGIWNLGNVWWEATLLFWEIDW
jgi:hypothetical protein